MSEKQRYRYTHKNKKEMMAFTVGHLTAAVGRENDADVKSLFKGQNTSGGDATARAASRKVANEKLFCLLISMIDNDDLVSHLATTYPEEGKEAIDYIKQSFDNGDESDRLSNANNAYLDLQTKKLDPDTLTTDDFISMCNEMDMARLELKNSFRQIVDPIHAWNLIDMISKIPGGYYRAEVRHLISKLDEMTSRRDPTKVQPVLEGIIRAAPKKSKTNSDTDLASALKILASADDPESKALVAKLLSRQNQGETPRCDQCGVRHKGKCKALLLSQGKTVPDWDKLDEPLKSRIQERANEIKEKGPYKDRAKVAIVKPMAAVGKVQVPESDGVEYSLYVDSQGAVGHRFHMIADRDLFTELDTTGKKTTFEGAVGDNVYAESQGSGYCDVVIYDKFGVGTNCRLQDCVYVPEMKFNVFNVWHANHDHGGASFFSKDDNWIRFQDGTTLELNDDHTATIAKQPQVAQVAKLDTSVITRGRHGATHVDSKPLTKHEKTEFELTMQRLNDPASERAHELHKVMDNVPSVLLRANYNNTATDARMLANAPAMHAPPSSRTKADRVGAMTQFDGWSAGTVSLLGNKYLFGTYDEHSTDFSLYPCKLKSQFPDCLDRYLGELHHDNVESREGGIGWSDNEAVMVGKGMKEVLAKHKRIPESAIQYEPTGNAGMESVFRIAPNEMRKIEVRTGVPEEFFEFTALEAERILRWTRARGDKTPGEIRTGKRADFLSDEFRGTFYEPVVSVRLIRCTQ